MNFFFHFFNYPLHTFKKILYVFRNGAPILSSLQKSALNSVRDANGGFQSIPYVHITCITFFGYLFLLMIPIDSFYCLRKKETTIYSLLLLFFLLLFAGIIIVFFECSTHGDPIWDRVPIIIIYHYYHCQFPNCFP